MYSCQGRGAGQHREHGLKVVVVDAVLGGAESRKGRREKVGQLSWGLP